jgi:hypothetical protein
VPRLASVLALASLATALPARAAEGAGTFVGPDLGAGVATTPLPGDTSELRTFGTLALGKGLRFNNPYRLATPIGDSPESVSFTATYVDLGVGAAYGPVDGFQHGGELALGIATDGISQQVLGLSYVLIYPLLDDMLLRGRGGFPIVLGPDANIGFELAAGGAWLFTGGIGATAELTGSLFYGAATLDKTTTAIPMLALELGLWLDYEVFP